MDPIRKIAEDGRYTLIHVPADNPLNKSRDGAAFYAVEGPGGRYVWVGGSERAGREQLEDLNRYEGAMDSRLDACRDCVDDISRRLDALEARTDPPVSERQRRAMRAAAGGSSTLGIPEKVGKEFSEADPGGKLPESKKDASELGYGTRVTITGGMKEFVGKTGTIQTKEGRSYRIKLDEPVEVPGVGRVKDDLWERSGFKVR